MSDLISRQDAIDAVERAKTARTEDGEIFCAKINAQMNIQLLPSAEPEVVRCKDCKRKNAIIEIGIGSGKRIEVLCGVFNIITQSDDFCSYGDRE